jgi:large subunit ribosomal protein L10
LAEERGEEEELNRQEKQERIAELRGKFMRAKAAVVTDYRGLKVEEITDLRRKLRAAGIEYRVVKNTLTRLAVQDTPARPLAEHMIGPCGVALGYDDEVTPAKVILDFARTSGKLEVKMGLLQGRIVDLDNLRKVVALPPKAELQAQFLGLLGVLPSRLLGVMSGVPRDFVSLLAATPRDFLGVLKAIERKAAQAS